MAGGTHIVALEGCVLWGWWGFVVVTRTITFWAYQCRGKVAY